MRFPEGVHQLRVPIPDNPLGFLLAYIIVGANGHTIIDTGWAGTEAYDSLLTQIRELGLAVKDIRQIILTHMHLDHSGLANRLRRETGATVFAHTMEAPSTSYAMMEKLRTQARSSTSPFERFGVPREVTLNSHYGRGDSHRHDLPDPDVMLQGGEIIDAGDAQLEVIWTPGHAKGHICLYDRKNRVLFCGDHVLPVTTPNISLQWTIDGTVDPLGDYLSSLEKLRPLEVDTAFPAHDHVFDDLQERLDAIAHHHEERLQEMRDSTEGKWTTPFEVARRVTWAIGHFDALEDTHKMMAVAETLAHLEFLHRRGEVQRKIEDGLVSYMSVN